MAKLTLLALGLAGLGLAVAATGPGGAGQDNRPAGAPVRSYDAAVWDPIHFKPAIETAADSQCLACHQEVLNSQVRKTSPAGLAAKDALAWYQTLDTYSGDQQTFHQRHITSAFATQVMDLKCNFCHRGHDPREEMPGSSATTKDLGAYAFRKVVDPSETCLLCHGAFPYQNMEGLTGPWHEQRADFEDASAPETRNGCLVCHDPESGFRSERHKVSYLRADAIERLAKESSSDVCYGCHGGRAWYRISYPYPRTPWPGMAEETPDWAKGRPVQSRYAIDAKTKQ
jgi:hypothetical protein